MQSGCCEYQIGLLVGYNASTRGVSWSSTTKEPSFSSAMRALGLPGSSSMRGLSAFSFSSLNQQDRLRR